MASAPVRRAASRMASMSRYEEAAGGGPMGTAASARRTGRESLSASEYTTTGDRPRSRQARTTRRAISPRLAIRIRCITTRASERNVAVLARWIGVLLVAQHPQRADDAGPRLARLDHGIHESPLGRHVGVGELSPELVDLGAAGRLRIGRGL